MSSKPPMHRPSLMKVDDVVQYLKSRYGMTLSRRSIYNWVKLGVRGTKLQHSLVPSACSTAKDREVVVISPAQIAAFLVSAGVSMK